MKFKLHWIVYGTFYLVFIPSASKSNHTTKTPLITNPNTTTTTKLSPIILTPLKTDPTTIHVQFHHIFLSTILSPPTSTPQSTDQTISSRTTILPTSSMPQSKNSTSNTTTAVSPITLTPQSTDPTTHTTTTRNSLGPKTCSANTDTRGTKWTETQTETVARQYCASGFTGTITRQCASNGVWQLPQYNCIRVSVQAVVKKVQSLNSSASSDAISDALGDMATVTIQFHCTPEDQKLTDGEISVLSSCLEQVAHLILSSSRVLNKNITNSFVESASNLIDDSNKDSWKSLADDNAAEKVLIAVDSLGEALSKSLRNSTDKFTVIVKKNLALEIKKFRNVDIRFPDEHVFELEHEETEWIRESQSHIALYARALTRLTGDHILYVATAVMYRDMSEILSSKRTASSGTGEWTENKREKINGPILALSVSPNIQGKLNPPVTIKFQHQRQNYATPQCVFWKFQGASQGYWSSDGCKVESTNDDFTVCTCDHLTNFAVLLSPFKQADANSKALHIISIVGISISIVCLIATFGVHFALWKYLKSDHTTSLMNLCIALSLAYIIFLAGLDRTENTYIFLVVFCVMLVKGILIAVNVLYVFKTNLRVRSMLVIAWVLPAVIVGISLSVTKTKGYGNEDFCWLSKDNGLIWSFVGPVLLIITFNIVCLIIVMRALQNTKAMETKKMAGKIKSSLRSIVVLLPILGVSWVLGIFIINDSFYVVQYIFAISNGLQGFFIFLFHCLLNHQVRERLALKHRRKSPWLKSISRISSEDNKNSKDTKVTERSNVGSGDKNPCSTYPATSNNWKEKTNKHVEGTIKITVEIAINQHQNIQSLSGTENQHQNIQSVPGSDTSLFIKQDRKSKFRKCYTNRHNQTVGLSESIINSHLIPNEVRQLETPKTGTSTKQHVKTINTRRENTQDQQRQNDEKVLIGKYKGRSNSCYIGTTTMKRFEDSLKPFHQRQIRRSSEGYLNQFHRRLFQSKMRDPAANPTIHHCEDYKLEGRCFRSPSIPKNSCNSPRYQKTSNSDVDIVEVVDIEVIYLNSLSHCNK